MNEKRDCRKKKENLSKNLKCVRPANHFAGRTQLITNFFYFCGLRNFYMTNTYMTNTAKIPGFSQSGNT